jgi:hypothetical protein
MRARGTKWLLAAVGLAACVVCGAQQMPVALTLHVTGRTGAPLGNETIGVANGTNAPFAHYRSDGQGNVTVVLAPGPHDLRIQARGLPVAAEHVDLSAPVTLEVALGRKPKPTPEPSASAAPAAPATPPEASSKAAPPPAPSKAPPSRHAATGKHASAAPTAPAPPVASAAAPAANPLPAWTSCFFPDGLEIQSADPLNANVSSREVDTAQGPQPIDLQAGVRVMFAYPFTDFFANAKAEELPTNEYAQEKRTLLANLAYMESEQGGPTPARPLPANLHGFDVRGNNIQKLQGTVLGMYLIFDDPAHVVTTVYFLNQQTWRRKFQSFEEYEQLRDRFLTAYTGCVRENQAIGR